MGASPSSPARCCCATMPNAASASNRCCAPNIRISVALPAVEGHDDAAVAETALGGGARPPSRHRRRLQSRRRQSRRAGGPAKTRVGGRGLRRSPTSSRNIRAPRSPTGSFAAILCQDPGHEARSAVRILRALADGLPFDVGQERIRIDILYARQRTLTRPKGLKSGKPSRSPIATAPRRQARRDNKGGRNGDGAKDHRRRRGAGAADRRARRDRRKLGRARVLFACRFRRGRGGGGGGDSRR